MELEKAINQSQFRNPAHKAMVNLIYTNHWINQIQVGFLKPFGLTSQQFNILRILRGQHPQPVSVKIIRERMLDKMSDASRIVEKLKNKGLLERTTCEKDRRSVDVVITEKGLALLEKIDLSNDQMDSMLNNLNTDEQEQLNYLLDKLRKE